MVSKFICFVLIYICVWTVHSVKCCSCQQAIQLSAESIAKFLLISFGSEWTLFRQISFGKFNVFQFRFKFMSSQWQCWLYLKLLLCNTIIITLKSLEKYRHENVTRCSIFLSMANLFWLNFTHKGKFIESHVIWNSYIIHMQQAFRMIEFVKCVKHMYATNRHHWIYAWLIDVICHTLIGKMCDQYESQRITIGDTNNRKVNIAKRKHLFPSQMTFIIYFIVIWSLLNLDCWYGQNMSSSLMFMNYAHAQMIESNGEM